MEVENHLIVEEDGHPRECHPLPSIFEGVLTRSLFVRTPGDGDQVIHDECIYNM